MSWHISAVGMPAEVKMKLHQNAASVKHAEPEQTVKNLTLAVICTALDSYPPNHPVRVEASGSQAANSADKAVNALNVKIEPLWGFLHADKTH